VSIKISERAESIKPSPTLSVAARAAALKASGRDIISLATGEPDFDTPDNAKEAAIQAIRDGFTKYTAVDGTPALKKAIIGKLKRENELDYVPDEILVSCGCKHSIYNLMQALLDPGDEVVVPAPYWASYTDMALLAGAVPVVVETDFERRFKMTPAELESALSGVTRLLILNSPCNPTGSYYTPDELKGLGEVLKRNPQVVIATDDIYEHILWEEARFHNILNVCPELKSRTVVLNGVSKAYAMTGWRIGYAAGPKAVIQTMGKIQSQSTTNATSIAQVAATEALNGDQAVVKRQCLLFKERHDYVYGRLRQMKDVEIAPSGGTFYSFPDLRKVIARMDGIDNDIAMAEHLLEQGGVALVPGSAFGADGYMRISFATSMEILKEAMDRLERIIGRK
jgi:aspartate aminotransferase